MKVLIINGLETLHNYLLLSKKIRIKFVTCGKQNCRCRLGERHGPYYYFRKKIANKYKDIYVKKPKIPLNLKYEEFGQSILLEIDAISKIPAIFKSNPTFLVNRKIN